MHNVVDQRIRYAQKVFSGKFGDPPCKICMTDVRLCHATDEIAEIHVTGITAHLGRNKDLCDSRGLAQAAVSAGLAWS